MQSLIFANFDESFNTIYEIETLIKLTKESCISKECTFTNNDLQDYSKILISEERNNYVNMLTIAEEKLCALKSIILNLETEAYKLQ